MSPSFMWKTDRYYIDELEKLTKKPARFWSRLPLVLLQKRLYEETRRWLTDLELSRVPAEDPSRQQDQAENLLSTRPSQL